MKEVSVPYKVKDKFFPFLWIPCVAMSVYLEILQYQRHQSDLMMPREQLAFDPTAFDSSDLVIHGLVVWALVVSLIPLWIWWFNRRNPRRLVLGQTSLSAPKGLFSTEIVEVPYSDILDVKRGSTLVIRHKGGKLAIYTQALPNFSLFNDLYRHLRELVDARKT